MSKTLGVITALLSFITLTAEKASADSDVVRAWATSNGAAWMAELEPAAQAVARGSTTLSLPQGSVSPWARGMFGYATLDEALASLGPAPTSGLVAAYAYMNGTTWNAGYVSIAEVVNMTVAPPSIPDTTVPRETTETTVAVVNEVSTTVAEISTTSTVPELDDDAFTVVKEATEVVEGVQDTQNDVPTGSHTPKGSSLPLLPASIVILLIGGAAVSQRKR